MKERLYPICFNEKFWKKEECNEIFVSFYHTKLSLDWQMSVYVSEGERIQPNGAWVK